MTWLELHRWFGWFVVASNGVAGAWVLAAHWRNDLRSKLLWRVVLVAQASIGVELMLGVLAQQSNGSEATGLHMFYGFIAFATVGILYSYRQQLEAWRYLLYGFGGLFLMGLAMRSMGWI